MSLIAHTDVAPALGWSSPSADQIARINAAIAIVESALVAQCDRVLEREVGRVEIIRVDREAAWRRIYVVELYPVESVEVQVWDLEEDKPDFSDPSLSLTRDRDFEIDEETGLIDLRKAGGWRFAVRLTGGYTAQTLPREIKQALILQTALTAQRERPEFLHVTSMSAGTGEGDSISLRDAHPAFKTVVQRYKRRMI